MGETRDPFLDHQVLAFGYEEEDGIGIAYVYDMNCPGAAQSIRLDFSGPRLRARESCSGGRGELAGFFCERYEPDEPPPA